MEKATNVNVVCFYFAQKACTSTFVLMDRRNNVTARIVCWLTPACLITCIVPRWFSRYSDSLRDGRSGDRIPVGSRFSAPAQTCLGAHPASYTMGTGSLPGLKRPGRGADPPPYSTEVKERVELFFYSPFGSSWTVLGRALPLP